ncbi:AAA family ATPase [Azotobacter vinelandii]
MGLKIAISGKGGVGKTTLTSLLAHHYARQGRRVLAIDADPSPCLGPALGFFPTPPCSICCRSPRWPN